MSLETKYDPDNVFAKIVSGGIPSVKVFETDDILSFMDVFPQSKGHCLVIHKHATATNLFDIPESDLQILISAVQKVGRAVKTALNPDGIRIAQFNGAPAGQTVFHLHFHIIPNYEGRTLGAHASGGPADTQELQAIAEKITTAL